MLIVFHRQIVLLILSSICLSAQNGETGNNDEQKLYESLFANYNKHLRPVKDAGKALKVLISPSISGIIQANELDQSLKFFQWLPIIWCDEKLQWDPHLFGGIQYMMVPSDVIWIPDVFAFTTMEASEIMPLEKTIARIEYTGNVTIVKHQLLTVQCRYHILMFPFDVQHCHMPFGSWSYTAEEVEVDPFGSSLAQQIFQENSEWDIVSFSPKKEKIAYQGFNTIANRTFQEVHYDLVFKRKPTFYIYMLAVPCSIIVNICLIGLFVPFNTKGDRQEKLSLGVATLLTVTIFLEIISGEMPKSAEGLPLLGTFVLSQLVICAVACVATVLIMFLHRIVIKKSWRAPSWFCIHLQKPSKSTKNNLSAEEMPLIRTKESPKTNDEMTTRETQSFMLKSCLENLHALKDHYAQCKDENERHSDWNRFFEFIDMILMIVFLMINFLITYLAFVVKPID